MPRLELQDFLSTQGLDALSARFQVKSRRHERYPELVCFKYSQHESPMESVIVQQCRGIVLQESQNWAVVSYPFNKFFNHGETLAAAIDWASASVQEKRDGSLCVLYFYDGQWQVQTSGTPDASGEVSGFKLTFAKLFWQTWANLGYQLPPDPAHQDLCFMFELETPYNRIVVRQETASLVLHGVRDRRTFLEHSPHEWADRFGWQAVSTFALTDLTAVLSAADALSPMDGEGFIVCDRQYNRIKIKSAEYVRLAHLKDGCSARRLLSVVVNNESKEVIAYFEDLADLFTELEERYAVLVHKIEQDYDTYKGIERQKDFALSVKALSYSGALFAIRAGKYSSVRDYLASLPIAKVEQYLDEICPQAATAETCSAVAS